MLERRLIRHLSPNLAHRHLSTGSSLASMSVERRGPPRSAGILPSARLPKGNLLGTPRAQGSRAEPHRQHRVVERLLGGAPASPYTREDGARSASCTASARFIATKNGMYGGGLAAAWAQGRSIVRHQSPTLGSLSVKKQIIVGRGSSKRRVIGMRNGVRHQEGGRADRAVGWSPSRPAATPGAKAYRRPGAASCGT